MWRNEGGREPYLKERRKTDAGKVKMAVRLRDDLIKNTGLELIG